MPSKKDYWQKRIDTIFDNVVKEKRLNSIYRNAFKNIEKEIQALYKVLAEGEITTTQLYQYNRFIQLQKAIKQQCKDIANEVNQVIYDALNLAYKQTFDATIDILGSSTTWGLQSKKMAEAVINKAWSGKHFSKRVWGNNTNILANTIKQEVTRAVIEGKNKDECVKLINEAFSSGFKNADRIVRTEVMQTINTAQVNTYKSEGIEQVEWLAELDARVCDVCRPLNGTIYDIDDMGVKIPVIKHPRCRCTILPIVKL